MKNRSRALAATVVLAVLAVGAAGCGTADPTALEVNGHDYSEASIDEELQAIADNPLLEGRATVSEGTLSSELTAAWLTTLVEEQVVADALERRGVEVTAEDLRAGPAAAAAFLGDQSVVQAFPKWLQERVGRRFAKRVALQADARPPVADADVRAAYDELIAEQKSQCASGRFAADILFETREAADAAVAEIAAGASFADVARTRSTDSGSAINGGELGCIDGQQFVPEFQTVVSTQPIGQVSTPVQTEFGYHVILVRDSIPFEAVADFIRNGIEQDTSAGDALVGRLTRKADVKVEPRFGRWVVRGGRGQVEPPAGARRPPPETVTGATPPSAP